MLQFTIPLSDEILLSNANTLRHDFNPFDSDRNTLTLSSEGYIVVSKRPKSSESPLQHTFAQEKIILIGHFEELSKYLKRRLAEISAIPVEDMKSYYQVVATFEGLIFICENFMSHVRALNAKIMYKEKESPTLSDFIAKLSHLEMQVKWQETMEKAEIVLSNIKAVQKAKLTSTQTVRMPIFGPEGFGIMEATSTVTPSFQIGSYSLLGHDYRVLSNVVLHMQSLRSHNKIKIFSICEHGSVFPVAMDLYPGWPTKESFEPLAHSQFETGYYGPQKYLMRNIEGSQQGCIGYQKMSLLVNMVGPINQVETQHLLPHFQSMVELGYKNNYSQVVLYAPYDFSARAYAFGFYSHDDELPYLAAQQQMVRQACQGHQSVPMFPEAVNQQVVVNGMPEEQFRPYYFDLSEIATREVFIAENPDDMQQTTYADLMAEKEILSQKAILPDFLGIPTKRFCISFESIRQREITGRLQTEVLVHQLEKLDLRCLQDDQQLQNIVPAKNNCNEVIRFQKIKRV